jgi:hypothetical protein
LSSTNSNLNAQKRKLESDVAAVQADLDEAVSELKNSEERAKKSLADAAKLAEEFRQEHVRLRISIIIKKNLRFWMFKEHALQVERARKGLEQQIKDLQARLEEAEASGLKGGKRIIQKLEQRVRFWQY